jgi:hypothetical protein
MEKMKTILVLAVISLFISFQLYGQEQTLAGNGEMSSSGFGGPVIKYTQIKDKPGVLIGGRGGWIINHTFVIGGGGYGLVTQIEADYLFHNDKTYLNFGYGGLELEYIIQSDNVLHFTVYTLIGAGGINYKDNHGNDCNNYYDWSFSNDEFFVLEPAINIEVNITSFFRLNTGVNYRFISGVNFDTIKNEDLSGVSGTLTLKFGSF